jgi:tRNA A37 threonylcarbamoyladenosine synthetase subunit TsaC/SUA5/YrdC
MMARHDMPNRLSLSPRQRHDDVVAAAVAVLQSGGIVAYPTDTLYGLAVDPRHPTGRTATWSRVRLHSD